MRALFVFRYVFLSLLLLAAAGIFAISVIISSRSRVGGSGNRFEPLISSDDVFNVPPVELAHCVQAAVSRQLRVEDGRPNTELVEEQLNLRAKLR